MALAPVFIEGLGRFYRVDGAVSWITRCAGGLVGVGRVSRFVFPTLQPLTFAESNLAVGRLYRHEGRADAPLAPVGWLGAPQS